MRAIRGAWGLGLCALAGCHFVEFNDSTRFACSDGGCPSADQRCENKTEADEQVIAFLKGLAKDMNLAIICLAHTTKGQDGRRPVVDDLRGSKMISAFADLVSFPYWPWKHATEAERERKFLSPEGYELIWEKVRQGAPGMGELYMDMKTMTIK